jgi:hypothetical protein
VPVIGPAGRQVLLKPVVVRKIKGRLAERDDGIEDGALPVVERTQLPASVVDDADRRREAERPRPPRDDQRSVGIADSAPDHGIDGDMKLATLGQPLELLIEDLQALLGHLVGNDVVDADLEVVETGPVQTRDPISTEQVSTRRIRRVSPIGFMAPLP